MDPSSEDTSDLETYSETRGSSHSLRARKGSGTTTITLSEGSVFDHTSEVTFDLLEEPFDPWNLEEESFLGRLFHLRITPPNLWEEGFNLDTLYTDPPLEEPQEELQFEIMDYIIKEPTFKGYLSVESIINFL